MKSNNTLIGIGLLAAAAYLLFFRKKQKDEPSNAFGSALNALAPLNLGASQARSGVNVRPAVTGTPQSSKSAGIAQDFATGAQIAVNVTDVVKGLVDFGRSIFTKRKPDGSIGENPQPPFRDDRPASNAEATAYYLNSPDVTIGADNYEPGSPGIPNRDFGLN